jgi:hypothetical protein
MTSWHKLCVLWVETLIDLVYTFTAHFTAGKSQKQMVEDLIMNVFWCVCSSHWKEHMHAVLPQTVEVLLYGCINLEVCSDWGGWVEWSHVLCPSLISSHPSPSRSSSQEPRRSRYCSPDGRRLSESRMLAWLGPYRSHRWTWHQNTGSECSRT